MGIMRKIYEKFSRDTGEAIHDVNGYEVPDPVPMAPPVGYKEQPTLREQMRAMIAEASHQAEMAGFESEEEANDFDVGDDFEPTSAAELDYAAAETMEVIRRKEADVKRRTAAQAPPLKPSSDPVAPDKGASVVQPAQPAAPKPEAS